MAITKIHAIKSTLGKALAYIENPDKTDGQMLVSGYNCEPQTASIDFEMTAVLAHKARNLKRKRSTNLAYPQQHKFLYRLLWASEFRELKEFDAAPLCPKNRRAHTRRARR